MAFPKGKKNPNAGRKKGVPNKNANELRNMILKALDLAGGAKYLHKQALENPGPFMQLLGKVLPKQIVGANDGPVQIIEMTTEQLTKIAAAEDGK